MSLYAFEIYTQIGDKLADLSGLASSRRIKISRNAVEDISFTLDLQKIEEYCKKINIKVQELFSVKLNEIRVKRLDSHKVGGQISTITPSISDRGYKLDVKALGFLSMFSKRRVGMSGPQQFSGDAGITASSIISSDQSVYGSFGIDASPAYVQASVARDVTFDNKSIKDAILDLASADNGFDFKFTPDKKFYVYYPRIGSDRSSEVIFSFPDNLISIEASIEGDKLANRIIIRGSGFGGSQYSYSAQNASSIATYKTLIDIVDAPDVTSGTFLQDLADEQLRLRAAPFEFVKIKVRPNSDIKVFEDYDIGDIVTLKVRDFTSFEDLNKMYRIEVMDVEITDDDVENVTLTLVSL